MTSGWIVRGGLAITSQNTCLLINVHPFIGLLPFWSLIRIISLFFRNCRLQHFSQCELSFNWSAWNQFCCSDNGSLCYMIDTNSQHNLSWWSVTLMDPMTVLKWMCINFNSSLMNMVHYFYHSGIPFNTCILWDIPEQQEMCYWSLSLGWDPKEHVPTTWDCSGYQATLDCLLTNCILGLLFFCYTLTVVYLRSPGDLPLMQHH